MISGNTYAFVTETNTTANVPLFCNEINNNDNNDVLFRIQTLMNDDKKTFNEAYSIAKNEYHLRINEIFNEHITKLEDNLIGAESNKKICAPFTYEKETNSTNVSRIMIANFREYECALEEYIKNPPLSGKEILYTEGAYTLQTIQSELHQEIRISYMSMEKAITLYNELRMWFPIHRDLLCLIQEMEIYRDSIKNFIDQVVRMPSKYYNYGSRYQQ